MADCNASVHHICGVVAMSKAAQHIPVSGFWLKTLRTESLVLTNVEDIVLQVVSTLHTASLLTLVTIAGSCSYRTASWASLQCPLHAEVHSRLPDEQSRLCGLVVSKQPRCCCRLQTCSVFCLHASWRGVCYCGLWIADEEEEACPPGGY